MDIFRILSRGATIREKQKKDLEIFRNDSAVEGETVETNVNFFAPKSTKRPVRRSSFTDETESRKLETQSEAAEFRGENKIKVTGDAPLPIVSFSELRARYNVDEQLIRSIKLRKYESPTPVQSEAIPVLLEGHDLVACAPTGSGKTLAFVAPIIQQLLQTKRTKKPRALIVSPTRELATQIYEVASLLSKSAKDINIANITRSMLGKLRNNNAGKKASMDLIISTPLRLIEGYKEGLYDLSGVQWLVLDEADRLLGDGFVEQTDDIVTACTNSSVVKAIFSATMPSNVEELARSIMTASVVRVIVGRKEAASSLIDQKLTYCGNEQGKLTAIRQMLAGGEVVPPILVFVQSIARAKALFHELLYDKVNVDAIHSELTQTQRDRVVANFKQGDIWVLICTDVLSRGIDFQGVNLVINYDIPLTAQSYVHRIGRTGRAGRRGKSVTFYTKQDVESMSGIINVMRQSGCEVSDWLMQEAGRARHDKPVKRQDISTVPSSIKHKKKQRHEMIEASKRRKVE